MQFDGKERFRLFVIIVVLGVMLGGGLYGWYIWLRNRIPTTPETNGVADLPSSGRPLAFSPTEEAMANNAGVSCAARGEYDRAIGCFRMAVSRKDDYLPGWKNLLAALVETERWPEALEAAEKAEGLHRLRTELGSEQLPSEEDTRSRLIQDKDFLANLARAYLENGRLDKAKCWFTLYLRLFPRELRGYNGLGEVAFREGDYERAVQLFAQSLKLYGDQPEVAGRLTEISEGSPEPVEKISPAACFEDGVEAREVTQLGNARPALTTAPR